MQKIAVIYVRVSGDKQKKEATIESQIESCLRYAHENNYVVPEGWLIQDNGFKGGNFRRPGLEKVRDIVRDNVPDAVIALCPDRLVRKLESQFVLEEEFRRAGTSIFYVELPPATNAEEQMNIHFRAVFAEYEREKIKERCRRGKNYKARQGSLSVIPKAPFGFDYISKSKSEKSQYMINEINSKVVKEIYNMYTIQQFPILKICRELDLKEIPTPRRGKSWDRSTVRDILSNSAYTGIAYFGKSEGCEISTPQRIIRKQSGQVFKSSATYRKTAAREDWIELSVPGFIEESQFCRAQELLKANKIFAARNTKHPSILQGILICKKCGLPLYKKARGKYFHYCCRSGLDAKMISCGSKAIIVETLDSLVWNEVLELLKNPELITAELNKRSQEVCSSDLQSKKINELLRDLKRIVIQRDKLLDAYQQTDCLTIDEFQRRMKNLNKQKINFEKAIESHKTSEIIQQSHNEILITLEQCVKKINRSSESLEVNEKQKILRLLIDVIVVDNKEILIKHSIPLNKSLVKEKEKCPLSGDRYNVLTEQKETTKERRNKIENIVHQIMKTKMSRTSSYLSSVSLFLFCKNIIIIAHDVVPEAQIVGKIIKNLSHVVTK